MRRPTSQSTEADEINTALALKAFGRLATIWGLSEAQQARLLDVSGRTYGRWRTLERPPLKSTHIERIGHVLAIQVALRGLFQGNESVVRWLNNAEGQLGVAPIELIRSGRFVDLVDLREYVERSLS